MEFIDKDELSCCVASSASPAISFCFLSSLIVLLPISLFLRRCVPRNMADAISCRESSGAIRCRKIPLKSERKDLGEDKLSRDYIC